MTVVKVIELVGIATGLGRLYEKAKPYVLASCDEVDLEYYISNSR